MVNARQITQFRDAGDGHGAWHAPQGLQGLDHRLKTPGVHRLVECLCETLQAFGGLVHRPDICLEDDVRRRGGTDHFSEPAQVGWAPRGPPRIATIVSEEERVEPELGGLEVTDGIFTRPGEVAHGFIFDLGHIHRRESTGAHEPRQWHGITAVGVHAVTRFFRNQGGGHDPALRALWGQVAIAPGPTGPSFLDQDERRGLGWERADALIDVTLTRANGPEGGDLGAVLLSAVGHRNGLLMDISADIKRARLGQG